MAESDDRTQREKVPRGDQVDPGETRDPNELRRRSDPDETVDQASDESFPASDPPSFTPTKAGTVRPNPDTGTERESPHGDAPSDEVERERP